MGGFDNGFVRPKKDGKRAIAPTKSTITYSTPGTYEFVVPAGVTRLLCQLTGGGGGGAASGAGGFSAGYGGGGAAFTYGMVSVSPGEKVQVVVGQGGLGGQTVGASGVDGGDSIVKTLTAKGGKLATNFGLGQGGLAETIAGDVIMSSKGGRGGSNAGSGDYAGAGGSAGSVRDGMDATQNSAGSAALGNGLIPNGGIASTGNQGPGGASGTGAGGTGGGGTGGNPGASGGNGRVRLDW